jgi:hypothetical protein
MMVALICILESDFPRKDAKAQRKTQKLYPSCVFLCAFAPFVGENPPALRRDRIVDNYVVRSQRRRSGALQVSQRLIVVSLCSQLRRTRVRECILALEQQERRRSSDLIQPLLTFELQLSIHPRFAC